MLCERCGVNKAEVHLMRIVNGKRVVDYLCRQCAKEVIPFDEAAKMMKMTLSLEGILDLQEALKDLILPAMTGMDENTDIELTCPHCGQSIPWSMLLPSEKKCAEKVPCAESTGVPAVKKDKLFLLKDEMAAAVKTENYELAAQIRDKIRNLEENNDEEKDA
ncbi:MAG: UvrB/UvrC motif-containing protein [Synergistaceae bacterium]|nr:UvrB/UvrC motif-containing protein [Synergistaceae bacterium]